MVSDITLRPYSEGDMWILEKTLGDSRQMVHLNGPESAETIRKRHARFLALSADPKDGCMFTILSGRNATPAGNVGYWESDWKGVAGWEVGWFVLPELQGRGIATAAMREVVEILVERRRFKLVYAFPSVDNDPSNAICRKLGFTLKEDVTNEYPRGSGKTLHVNVWALDLPV